MRYVINMLGYYFRLTPALIAVVLFYAYVMEHLGAGPQWTSSVTSNADLCKTHLWRNILYIQNFFMFEEMVSEKSLFLTYHNSTFSVHLYTVGGV